MFGATSLVAFSALLGLNHVMIKIVNTGLQPVFQAGLRSLLALPIVLIYCLIFRKRLSFKDGSFWPGIICGVMFGGEFVLLFLALDYTSVSRAAIFFYTMPFWVALAAHFLIPGERLTLLKISGLFLAFAGVVLVLSSNNSPATPNAWIGDILCLLGAAMWATIAILVRVTKLSRATPEMQLIYQLLVSAPFILIVSLFFGPLIRELEMHHIAIFAVQVVFVVSFGFAFWLWLMSLYPASAVASFGFLSPVFGVFFGWLILGEHVGATLLIALAMVGTGIVLVNRKAKPQTPD